MGVPYGTEYLVNNLFKGGQKWDHQHNRFMGVLYGTEYLVNNLFKGGRKWDHHQNKFMGAPNGGPNSLFGE
jgi:hypothetical protein